MSRVFFRSPLHSLYPFNIRIGDRFSTVLGIVDVVRSGLVDVCNEDGEFRHTRCVRGGHRVWSGGCDRTRAVWIEDWMYERRVYVLVGWFVWLVGFRSLGEVLLLSRLFI